MSNCECRTCPGSLRGCFEVDSNPQPSSCKAPNIPLHHRAPVVLCCIVLYCTPRLYCDRATRSKDPINLSLINRPTGNRTRAAGVESGLPTHSATEDPIFADGLQIFQMPIYLNGNDI